MFVIIKDYDTSNAYVVTRVFESEHDAREYISNFPHHDLSIVRLGALVFGTARYAEESV